MSKSKKLLELRSLIINKGLPSAFTDMIREDSSLYWSNPLGSSKDFHKAFYSKKTDPALRYVMAVSGILGEEGAINRSLSGLRSKLTFKVEPRYSKKGGKIRLSHFELKSFSQSGYGKAQPITNNIRRMMMGTPVDPVNVSTTLAAVKPLYSPIFYASFKLAVLKRAENKVRFAHIKWKLKPYKPKKQGAEIRKPRQSKLRKTWWHSIEKSKNYEHAWTKHLTQEQIDIAMDYMSQVFNDIAEEEILNSLIQERWKLLELLEAHDMNFGEAMYNIINRFRVPQSPEMSFGKGMYENFAKQLQAAIKQAAAVKLSSGDVSRVQPSEKDATKTPKRKKKVNVRRLTAKERAKILRGVTELFKHLQGIIWILHCTIKLNDKRRMFLYIDETYVWVGGSYDVLKINLFGFQDHLLHYIDQHKAFSEWFNLLNVETHSTTLLNEMQALHSHAVKIDGLSFDDEESMQDEIDSFLHFCSMTLRSVTDFYSRIDTMATLVFGMIVVSGEFKVPELVRHRKHTYRNTAFQPETDRFQARATVSYYKSIHADYWEKEAEGHSGKKIYMFKKDGAEPLSSWKRRRDKAKKKK